MAIPPGSRIPAGLQAIFMASNQGQDVHEPPKDGSAFRVFRRGGVLKRNRSRSFTRHPFFQGIRSMFGKVSPQALFLKKLKERGYKHHAKHFQAKRSGYFNQPTDLQLASYGSKLLGIVKHDKTLEFRAMLEAGLSPNACNSHGESLLHTVCRHGQIRLFRILVEFMVDPRQTDDIGRTPLHEACCATMPAFEIVSWLIQSDPGVLFLMDERGSLPLDNVGESTWPQWNQFIDERMDDFFPKSNSGMDITPGLWGVPPHSRPVGDPYNALTPFLARKIASGALQPHELHMSANSTSRSDSKKRGVGKIDHVDEDEGTAEQSDYDSDESSCYSDSENSSYDSEDEDLDNDNNYLSRLDDANEFLAFQRRVSRTPIQSATPLPYPEFQRPPYRRRDANHNQDKPQDCPDESPRRRSLHVQTFEGPVSIAEILANDGSMPIARRRSAF